MWKFWRERHCHPRSARSDLWAYSWPLHWISQAPPVSRRCPFHTNPGDSDKSIRGHMGFPPPRNSHGHMSSMNTWLHWHQSVTVVPWGCANSASSACQPRTAPENQWGRTSQCYTNTAGLSRAAPNLRSSKPHRSPSWLPTTMRHAAKEAKGMWLAPPAHLPFLNAFL